MPCPPVSSLLRASFGTRLLWPREDRDGSRGWQVTRVEDPEEFNLKNTNQWVGIGILTQGGQDWGG